MKKLVALALVVWEPARFAAELLMVYSTIWYRGWVAIAELLAHGIVAAVSVSAGLALRNDAPHASRLAQIAVGLATLRFLQSLYWSALPGSTVPGDEPLYAAAAVVIGTMAMLVLRRTRET